MILNHVTHSPSYQDTTNCWASIRRYENINFTADLLHQIHSCGKKDRNNLLKQAEQIRYCLQQAKEYYDASQTVSLVTRPLLLYYSIMSLALAEVLYKQDGNSSLDRARSVHKHHGLSLSASLDKNDKFLDKMKKLIAKPNINNNQRTGTFDLWHRSSREAPLGGTIRTTTINGGTTSGYGIVLIPQDKRMDLIPDCGIELLKCLTYLPCMLEYLAEFNISSPIIRATISEYTNSDTLKKDTSIAFHPSDNHILNKLFENIIAEAHAVSQMNYADFGMGGVLSYWSSPDDNFNMSLPQAMTSNTKEVRFPVGLTSLNEFGLFYVALYILGNYARYYPDFWAKDVENSDPIALITDYLCRMSEKRVPILFLSELQRRYIISE